MSRKTIPRETEKPKKLTRAQKKEIDAVLRKYKGDGKPRTAQATIPYEAIYPDGVCRIDRRTFSKCIAFEDISYQLAQPETRTAIFEHLCDLYNYVDASIHVQLSFLNRKVDPVQYAKSFEIAPQGDDFDDIRAEYTAILQKQLASGNNGIVKTKYLTFTIEADNLKTARARLTRIGLDLLGYFKTMGCVAHVMDGQARLEVLHGIFHPDGEPFRFDWDWLAPSGLSTKDFVAPSSLCFGTAKTFGLGGKYGAVSFLQILAPELSDEMLADFLKTESGILVNLHVQAIDQTEAIKTIKRKITDLDAMKIQEQKKAVRSGYDMDILPSDLATYGEDAKKLLNKLQTRNERLFMLTFLVLNVADTKQKLGNDVFQAAGVAQKYNCSLVRLDYQQEQGLVSSLPLGINQMEFIEKLPQGIHSMAGDAGKMLSGGQRQRISLARAILKDAPIVVLDEATAYADPENEEKMEAAIAELVKGKTLVVIAHKLPAIMNADQICVIDHGKLVAAGKHQDLIRSCPEYQKLWKAAQDSAEWKVHTAKEGA
mgnify:CR=1 FL=1